MIRVWYHADCNDGLAAAAVAYKRFGSSAEYTPVKYDGLMPRYNPEDTIFILDFSYPYHILSQLGAYRLIVLDHHKTAQDELIGKEWSDSNYIHFDLDKSGARLAWEYFFKDEDIPLFIKMIEDRDLWKFRYDDTNALHAGLELTERSPNYWSLVMVQYDMVQSIIKDGRTLLKAKEAQISKIVENSRLEIIGGHHVPSVNSCVHMSDIGNKLCELNPGSPFSAVWFVQADGRRKYSLRSTGFDCSVIAKMYGGGGHPKASGFVEADNLADKTWIQTAIDSNKALDSYLRTIAPWLPEHYGMPVDGVREVMRHYSGALSFASSVIKSGESWSPACENLIGNVLNGRKPK